MRLSEALELPRPRASGAVPRVPPTDSQPAKAMRGMCVCVCGGGGGARQVNAVVDK